MMVFPLTFICIFTLLSLFTKLSMAIDTLSPNKTLTDNGKPLVSSGEAFELGFFNPPYSNNRYIGIWFKNVPIRTPIWVANKNNPISDSSGLLTITATGNIIITTNQTTTIWSSSNSSPPTPPNNPIMQLLDSGNLVVKNGGGDYLWQSFDYPCDTLVPGMKLGWNLRTNQEWFLTSWKTLQDPSSGDYTYKLDRRGLPQIVLRQGSKVNYRSGFWDGVRFGGDPPLEQNTVFDPIFIFNSTDVYFSFKIMDGPVITRLVVNQTGLLQFLTWNERRGEWFNLLALHRDACDAYATCGPYGICRFDGFAVCNCPNGFIPGLQHDWDRFDWSGGCVRRTPMNCSVPQGFRKLSGLKLPDTTYFFVNKTKMSQVDCEKACLRNCTCVAFAQTSVSGCVLWLGELFDMKESSEGGQDLYIRMAASDLGSNKKNKRATAITSIIVISGVLVLSLIGWYFLKELHKRRAWRLDNRNQKVQDNNQGIVEDENLALLLFDLATVSSATNNFSLTNKIGEGGFGPVYRGELTTGREIAVKRLSKTSRQGLSEFKNEVILISKLQHRNLVRLLGCCIHEEERMLIYEYMPNKSLDTFIFNQTRGTSLDWKKRFGIIVGIARGLLYLHRDSRLRVIHRDLKAGNILLDSEMNPKIADFGLARSFGGDQFEENTNRVIGTYGYMSPEYAINGHFSVKSDVFSFGVMVLEIVSGKKNRGFYDRDHGLNLLGHAWKLWHEEKPIKLFDVFMEDPNPTSEVLRCIQVALLCVQQRPEDRPTMSYVLLMLDSENPVLPMPKQPGFYSERVITNIDYSSIGKHHCTTNEVTITMLHGR
ncbi:G-type lectin S-receptor-like serine/threonine-protein kinase At4g27290 [Camellia sinensis]|uniref:G-type lectin S-receptor-like serine/threonine-protein kinase At4g27290 n=1 Tax=Camellia sinensis TaxID=4442 RepID=UPI001036DAA6|nr:G-type lectin S-receptor-like serine/threonine-protein kinase At4g27290 [Camellia sinensis]